MNLNAIQKAQRVKRGDPIEAEHLRALAELMLENTLLPAPGYCVQRVPGAGVFLALDPVVADFAHPWRASLTGTSARVASGALNSDIPWLADEAGPARPLDGFQPDGKPGKLPAPTLELRDDLFNADGYSWGTLRVFIDPATGGRIKVADGGLTLAQTDRMTWSDGGSVDQIAEDGRHYGDHPLFVLRRGAKEKTGFGKLTQHTFFNLQHRFVGPGAGAEEGATGRHFFFV